MSRSFREYEVCFEGKFVVDDLDHSIHLTFPFFLMNHYHSSRKRKSVDVGLRRDFMVSNWKFEGLSFHVFVWKKGGLPFLLPNL